jgi:hypothetical protein
MPDPSRRPCTCHGRMCGKKHGRYSDTRCGEPVRVGVICDECMARMNANAKKPQHRTPQMADNFEDCELFKAGNR